MQPLLDAAKDFWDKNKFPILSAFIASIVVYSSVVTQFIFSDHTLPNIGVYGYPSFKTLNEGRWFADILIRLGGGGGTQSFQAIVALFIQAVNGALFAVLLGVNGRFNRTIVTFLIVLHPAVLDYYAFSVDDLTFTFGDTLSLLAIMLLDRKGGQWWTWPVAAFLFMLSIASYQPKLAVFAVVAIGWLTACIVDPNSDSKVVLRKMISAAVAFGGGLLFYMLSLKLTLDPNVVLRNDGNSNMNTMGEAIQQFGTSYGYVIETMRRQWNSIPFGMGTFAKYLSLLGLVVLIVRSVKKGPIAVGLLLLCLIALPPAINLSAVANKNSWQDTGRIAMGYTYCLAFLAAAPLALPWIGAVARILAALVLWGFFVIATQENQFMSTKTVFETALMSRIVGRIETLALGDELHPLVVVGDTYFGYGDDLLAMPRRPLRPQFQYQTYVSYRQPQLTNFFVGRDIVRAPTDEERAAAEKNAIGRPLWPAPGSVYLDGNTIVVVMKPPGT